MSLKDIIRQTIDIHVHIGPEIIPRKYTVASLVKAEAGKVGGFVLKNHFYPTQTFINEIRDKKNIKLFGGIVLNNAVGGLNPETIYTTSLLTDKPIMVWFPTINAENFLNKSEFEIPSEWVKNKNFSARKAKDVKPVKTTRNKKLKKEVIQVLATIKQYGAVLATGHISWKESILVIEKAKQIGVKDIIVTHPIYQRIKMPITIQKDLAQKGCFIEQSYSMYAIDKIPIKKIANQIKEVGTQSVILSSDVGQTFSPSPSQALLQFATLLRKERISEDQLFSMMVANPKKLLGI